MLICKLEKQIGEEAKTLYSGYDVVEAMKIAFDEIISGTEDFIFFDILDQKSTVMMRSNFISDLNDLHRAARVLDNEYKSMIDHTLTRVAIMKFTDGEEEIFHVKSVPAKYGFSEKDYTVKLIKLIDEKFPNNRDDLFAILIVKEFLGEDLAVNEYHVDAADFEFLENKKWNDTIKDHSMIKSAISPTAER